jgi:hypothetical protein
MTSFTPVRVPDILFGLTLTFCFDRVPALRIRVSPCNRWACRRTALHGAAFEKGSASNDAYLVLGANEGTIDITEKSI